MSHDGQFTDYTIRGVVDRHICEHEIFLSFTNDEDAEWFQDWLELHGMMIFADYHRKRKELRDTE